MARKDDLLEEAAALGIEGLDASFRNDVIQEYIDTAKAEASQPDEDATEESGENQTEEVVEEVPAPVQETSEPVFTLAQLKPYAEQLFGVGYHVLVGARSAGFIPEGRVTREQVGHGIDSYMNMPVNNKGG